MTKKHGDQTNGALDTSRISNGMTSVVQKVATRRQFLKVAGLGGLGMAALYLAGCGRAEAESLLTRDPVKRIVYSANAEGMIIGNPTRCVGCRRCELACTEYNEGKSHPAIARVNVRRNWSFGPEGAQVGFGRGDGRFGNHRIIQETCRQCPHPIPCRLACPYDAIEVVPPVGARVINQEKCQGCRICQRACPWGMTTFDEEIQKATKCHLCDGDPECVKMCPSGALQYVPWQDRTKDIQSRFVVPAYIESPAGVEESCAQCH